MVEDWNGMEGFNEGMEGRKWRLPNEWRVELVGEEWRVNGMEWNGMEWNGMKD